MHSSAFLDLYHPSIHLYTSSNKPDRHLYTTYYLLPTLSAKAASETTCGAERDKKIVRLLSVPVDSRLPIPVSVPVSVSVPVPVPVPVPVSVLVPILVPVSLIHKL